MMTEFFTSTKFPILTPSLSTVVGLMRENGPILTPASVVSPSSEQKGSTVTLSPSTESLITTWGPMVAPSPIMVLPRRKAERKDHRIPAYLYIGLDVDTFAEQRNTLIHVLLKDSLPHDAICFE